MALFSGRKHDAEELLETMLARAEQLVGSQHPIFAAVLQPSADMCFRQKRYGPAKQFLEQALGILERFYGHDARELRRCLEACSAVLRAMKEKSQAKEINARIGKLAAN
jgi:tetratricopeptide repeat protein